MEAIHISIKEEIDSVNTYYNEQLQKKSEEVKEVEELISQHGKNHIQKSLNVDERIERETTAIQYRFELKLKDERAAIQEIQTQHDELTQKQQTLLQKIEHNKAEVVKCNQKERSLHSVIKTLEKEIVSLKKELQKRIQMEDEKEMLAENYKKKNKELEKNRFMLDYKIIEMRKQIEPREEDIRKLSSQIESMKVEVADYREKDEKLKYLKDDVQLKYRGVLQELKFQKSKAKEVGAEVTSLLRDLEEVALCNDPVALKRYTTELYQKYCLHNVKTARVELANAEHRASNRERELLEKSIHSLQSNYNKHYQARETESRRFIEENIQLVRDVNDLRKELKYHQDRLAGV
ncbi:hypothetical protein BKA69DRAFT_138355 [Paraphysoderma sedebokerense]|nr:hypothetical protein BKA69DRAFT_138355 [Paraphysoderma sedebokerense]